MGERLGDGGAGMGVGGGGVRGRAENSNCL